MALAGATPWPVGERVLGLVNGRSALVTNVSVATGKNGVLGAVLGEGNLLGGLLGGGHGGCGCY